MLVEEVQPFLPLLVAGDADDLHTAVFVSLFQFFHVRNLLEAWDAPGPPEVDEEIFPPEVLQAMDLSFGVCEGEVGSRLTRPNSTVFFLCSAVSVAELLSQRVSGDVGVDHLKVSLGILRDAVIDDFREEIRLQPLSEIVTGYLPVHILKQMLYIAGVHLFRHIAGHIFHQFVIVIAFGHVGGRDAVGITTAHAGEKEDGNKKKFSHHSGLFVIFFVIFFVPFFVVLNCFHDIVVAVCILRYLPFASFYLKICDGLRIAW